MAGVKMTKAEAEEAMFNVEIPQELVGILDEIEHSSTSDKSPRAIVFHSDKKPVAYRSHFEYFIERRLLKENKFIIHIENRFANPVFGPPGVMAVTKVDGNGYEILLSKYMGSLNPRECYPLFKKTMEDFYKFIMGNKEYKNAPWVIHPMDYFKKGRLRIYEDVIKIFQPTVIAQLSVDAEMARDLQNSGDGNFKLIQFDALAHEEYYKSIHEYTCLVNNWNRGKKPSIRRIQKFERYFKGATVKTVSLNTCGIGSMSFASNFWSLLNGMSKELVAVCKFSPSTTFFGSSPRKWLGNAWRFSNEFIGYGIVRSINSTTKEIELITTVSQDILDEEDVCLVTADGVRLDGEFCMSILKNSTELVE